MEFFVYFELDSMARPHYLPLRPHYLRPHYLDSLFRAIIDASIERNMG